MLADPTDHVDALWTPDTGDLVVWHRGPTTPKFKYQDPAGWADVLIPDPGRPELGRLVRLDLTTGVTTDLLPRLSTTSGRVRDDLYVEQTPQTSIDVPIDGLGSSLGGRAYGLRFADVATGIFYPIADDITGVAAIPDEGLVYLDAHGPDPGVWAVPFPR